MRRLHNAVSRVSLLWCQGKLPLFISSALQLLWKGAQSWEGFQFVRRDVILISLDLLGRVGKGQEFCKGDHGRCGMWGENVLRQKPRNTALCRGAGAHRAKPCSFYHKCVFPDVTWRTCEFISKILWMLFLSSASISFRFPCAVYEKKKKEGKFLLVLP